MKFARTVGTLSLLAFAAIATPSIAQEAGSLGWYVGASVGPTQAHVDTANVTDNPSKTGYTTTSVNNDKSSSAFKLLGGYQLSKNVAFEAGYFDLGRFGYTATTVPAGTVTSQTKVYGVNLDVVGILPINDKFSLLGRVGVINTKAKDAFSGTNQIVINNANQSKTETNVKFGAGLQYAFNDMLSGRVDIERYRVNDAAGNRGNIDTATVGVVYRIK